MTDTAQRALAPDLDFRPAERAATTPRPLVLVLPGGGYVNHADHEGGVVADWLGGLGIATLTLRYPVAPARYPAALLRAQEVLASTRAGGLGDGVDTTRIGVLGFSAGGHLAAQLSNSAATGDAARVDLAVLAYPVTSMVHEPHAGSLASLLGPGSDGPESWNQRRALSQELRVDASTPPTFLWHTTEDATVPVSHSLRYAAALAEHDVPFELHVFERGAHGTGLGHGLGALEQWTTLCATWLRGRGWAGQTADGQNA